jgi:hypothetical protein
MKRPTRLPTIVPTFRRNRIERANLALAVVYIVSIVVAALDVFVWRAHG